jgi:transaldolase/glucose-6-phosphate isomerase
MIDGMLKAMLKATSDAKEQALLRSLMGKVAIANGKLTYQRYKEIFRGTEWTELAKKGAQTQRVLWASTSTKDPSYSDVLYIEELIGPDTVNTIPPATFEAFRDHGKPRPSLEVDIDAAQDTMDTLEVVGISMKKVTDDLVTQGVKLFAEPFDKLLNVVDAKCKHVSQVEFDQQTYSLPDDLNKKLGQAIDDWKMAGKVRRLWARDASLWTRSDEGNWLGWLGVTEDQVAHKQWLEPGARSSQDDLRQNRRFPRTVRTGLHRPGAGEGFRKQNRHPEHDLHCVQQVGFDVGAEYF